MSGRQSRDKGNRLERALVRTLRKSGFAAERVPLSGAMHGRFGGDLSLPLLRAAGYTSKMAKLSAIRSFLRLLTAGNCRRAMN
jgi:hypothetical protein